MRAMIILALVLSQGVWAQECTQTIIGGASFWSCGDLELGLAERASQGDSTAQYEMGMAYLKGKGAKQDYEQAAHWFGLATEQGVTAAQYQLGNLYAEGKGVEQDIDQALAAWVSTAFNGYGAAQRRLGESYDKGEGVAQDNIQAYVWYSLAAGTSVTIAGEVDGHISRLKGAMSDTEFESAEEMRRSLYQQILMNKLMQKARPR